METRLRQRRVSPDEWQEVRFLRSQNATLKPPPERRGGFTPLNLDLRHAFENAHLSEFPTLPCGMRSVLLRGQEIRKKTLCLRGLCEKHKSVFVRACPVKCSPR